MKKLGKLSRIALLLMFVAGSVVSLGCAEKESSSPAAAESGSAEGGGEDAP